MTDRILSGEIIAIVFIGAVVFVVGYTVLWLLKSFGILQHFGISLLGIL